MRRRLTIPPHPFLFALYPILSLFSYNKEQLLPFVIFKPLIIILSVTVFLFILLSFGLLKNIRKGAFLTSFCLFIFFSYGHFKNIFLKNFNFNIKGLAINQETIFIILWLIVSATGIFFIKKTTRDLKKTTNFLTIIAAVLILITLITIVSYELKTKRLLSFFQPTNKISQKKINKNDPGNYPDIYYLIFDRYGANSVLKEEFGYDNSQFTDFLEDQGFYIAYKSSANYPKTFESLASSLNIQHLTFLTEKLGENNSDQTPINKMLDQHLVGNFLKEKGYTYYHLGSWWGPTAKNSLADKIITWNYLGLDEFSKKLLETTLASPIITKINAAALDDTDYLRIEQKQRIPYKIKKLLEISQQKGPKFVFTHFIFPHGPYVFNTKGNPVSEQEAKNQTDEEGYLNQLQFANIKIKEIVQSIINNSPKPPVIIIQADEGPCDKEITKNKGWGYCGEDLDWNKLSNQSLNTKMKILNAYYLPRVDMDKILYQDITPVNTFRIVFNEYFKTGYPLLPDTVYIFQDMNHPYKFIDITKKIKK